MQAKYIDPFTDFGFKRIFGQEASKPLLRDFLNSLLPPTAQIQELSFKNTEQTGGLTAERRAIFDIYCENEKGERFIVELQKAKQNHFKDRTVFYSTFPIREQAEAGTWDFGLKAVYCVGILDFVFNDDLGGSGAGEVLHEVKLKNQHGAVFYDKLTYYYLEMPNFRKTEAELVTRLDQWLYFLKHLERLESIPALFRDAVFMQALETAAVARMSPEESDFYEGSKKAYRDEMNKVNYALQKGHREGHSEGRKEGLEEGRLEGRQEAIAESQAQIQNLKDENRRKTIASARILKTEGVAPHLIALATGLTIEEIESL